MGSASQRLTVIKEAAVPLTGTTSDYDALMESIGDARFVLLGEASHGTEEFYRARADISRRLIQEKGFSAIAVEADWPDAWRVNRFIRGQNDDTTAQQALGDFRRFPLWMWRNHAVAEFIASLRDYNEGRSRAQQVGFYGLDLYSLYASIEAIVAYLEKVDPPAAIRAREFYACLGDASRSNDGREYGRAVKIGMQASCEDAVVEQLLALQKNSERYTRADVGGDDEQFHAEQNARLVQHAEEYYRGAYCRGINTWNLRDQHMMDTLVALSEHLSRQGGPARIVVWEHNSHIGDARATEMGQRGDHNVGQLIRQRFDRETFLLGFTTYHGTVAAADDWDEPMRIKAVTTARPDSYEHLFHETGLQNFYLSLRDTKAGAVLDKAPLLLERAIGVIYRPETERASHYFLSALGRQFDGVVHFDQTHAVFPLDMKVRYNHAQTPETYPFGV